MIESENPTTPPIRPRSPGFPTPWAPWTYMPSLCQCPVSTIGHCIGKVKAYKSQGPMIHKYIYIIFITEPMIIF